MNPNDSEMDRPRPETESTSKPKASTKPSASTGSAVGLFGWRDVDQSIGPYTIIELLGHGGQATVYRALDRRVDRTVALKVLRGGGNDLLGRFRREAEVTARLDHPSICPIYEVGLDGVPFIAMKLIEGETLAQHLSAVRTRAPSSSSDKSSFVDLQASATETVTRLQDPPPRPASPASSNTPHDRAEIFGVLRLVEQIARALHVAHEAGIIHRDIKPGNLMIQKDGTPVILDFGLAYQEDHAGPSLSETGQILGTPAYMAPEQLAAKPMRVDRRADIYSLGVTLYECLTLRRPFDAPSRAALYHAIACEAPPDPRKLNAALSADVRVVLLKALEKDPVVRFQTALDFAEELRRVRSFEPIRTRPVGALTRHVRWVQRNPGWAVALYGIVLALSLAVGVFALKNSELDRANTDLRLERKALARKTSEANALAETATKSALTAEANAVRAGENAARAESESTAKGVALQEKSKALEERTKAVEDYDRLADSTLLAQATVEADRLYPIAPALLEKIAAWQDRYGPLFKRLNEHEATLAALRRLAAPYTAADRAVDYPEDAASIALLEARATAARSKADASPSNESLVEAAEDLEDAVKAAKAAYIAKAPRSPDFGGDVRLRFKHDVLAKLVQDLRAFAADKVGTLADVELRKRRSELIRKETIEDQAKAWADVAARVATNPRYAGLKIAPRLGLIPLGPDPTSTLEEFLDWRTHDGAIPRRDGNARLRVEETTGLVFVLIPRGTSMRGAQKEDTAKPNFDPDARDDESPVRSETVEAFFMSK